MNQIFYFLTSLYNKNTAVYVESALATTKIKKISQTKLETKTNFDMS